MRKLIVSIHLSLDGYYASEDGSLDWQFPFWAEDLDRFALQQLMSMDAILLGRRTYEGMAAHWPAESSSYAELMNRYPKFVATATAIEPRWPGAKAIHQDPAAWVRMLKQDPGKDMIIYGSVSLVRSLAAAGLIDEYRLWIHPVVLGEGLEFFSAPMRLKHLRSLPFSTGVVMQAYGC